MHLQPFTPPKPGDLTRAEADELNRWLAEVARQDRTATDGALAMSDTGAGWNFALASDGSSIGGGGS